MSATMTSTGIPSAQTYALEARPFDGFVYVTTGCYYDMEAECEEELEDGEIVDDEE